MKVFALQWMFNSSEDLFQSTSNPAGWLKRSARSVIWGWVSRHQLLFVLQIYCLISLQRWETWRFTSSWTTRRRGKKGWLGRVLVSLASSLPHLRPPRPPRPPPPWPPPPQLPPDCQTWTSNELFPMSKIMNQSQKIYNSWFSGLLWSPRPRQPTLLQTLNRGSTKVQNTKCCLISISFG